MADFAYDQIQYESYPYSGSHPENLYTLAKLFGLSPQHYTRARILELGCASGGNIIPIAFNYPASQVVGLDLSSKQIETGKALIEALNLSNIELLTLSILDVDSSLGQFDYIICHGIYSWVEASVRDKILAIFKENLAPQGIAYISYNTYPGWHGVQSVRDMMLFHIQGASSPENKATQARALLQFLIEGLEGEQTLYSEFLQQEIDLLKHQPDSYLLHDHLEEVNFPIYFHSFMAHANKHKLDYLSDSKLNLMFAGNLPEKAAKVLSGITDIVHSNQYLDFIRNQRFRATLLCLNTVSISRALKTEQIEDFYISYSAQIDKEEITPENILTEGVPLVFVGTSIALTVRHPLSKIAMLLLEAQNGVPIAYSDLVSELKQKSDEYHLNYEIDFIQVHLKDELNLLRLVFGGILELHSGPALYTLAISNTPMVTLLAREQSKKNHSVTNQRHEVVKLNDLERIMLQALDGKTTQVMMIEYLYQKIEKGDFSLTLDSKEKITDKNEIKSKLNQFCDQIYQKFAKCALFIS